MGFSLAQFSPTVLCMFLVASATFGCHKELLEALSSSSVLQECPTVSRHPDKTTLQSNCQAKITSGGSLSSLLFQNKIKTDKVSCNYKNLPVSKRIFVVEEELACEF